MKHKLFTLGDFIEQEMKQRGNISLRAFAEEIGVSHTTLANHIKHPDTRPSLDFLERLSDKTGASLNVLIMLASPALAKKSAISARALLFAQEFDKLGNELQDVLLTTALTFQGKHHPKK